MTRFLSSCLLLIAVALPASASQQQAIDELAQRLNQMQSLSAQFMQTTRGQQTREQTLSGELSAQKPGKFRWLVKQPYQQTIVSDGRHVHIYDPDLEQLIIKPLGSSFGETPALLFSGNSQELNKQFTASKSLQNGITTYVLKPRSKDALFSRLTVAFNGQLPTSLILHDASGTQTEVKFIQAKYNAALPPSQFNFVAPSGTDIIRE